MRWRAWRRQKLRFLKVIYRITSITCWKGGGEYWRQQFSPQMTSMIWEEEGKKKKKHDVRSQVSQTHEHGLGATKALPVFNCHYIFMNTGYISRTTLQFTTVQWKESFLTSQRTNLLWYLRLYVKQWHAFKAHTVLYFIGHKYQTTLVSHHLHFLFASTYVSFSLLRKTVPLCGILQNTDFVYFLSYTKAFRQV